MFTREIWVNNPIGMEQRMLLNLIHNTAIFSKLTSFITGLCEITAAVQTTQWLSYRLDAPETVVRFPTRKESFCSPKCPDQLCGSPNLTFSVYQGLFFQR
jgi:hypothetical protein